ncbi:hypothetical protein ABIC74_003099 [Mucilaginibacter rubeus]
MLTIKDKRICIYLQESALHQLTVDISLKTKHYS